MKTEEKRQQIEQERKDFINGMAHELKTPLAIIRMCDDNLRIQELEFKKDYYLDMISHIICGRGLRMRSYVLKTIVFGQ